jgi:hypothetical protein
MAARRGICKNRPVGERPLILSVGGVRADQLSMLALRRYLCLEGKEFRMTIMRGEEKLEVTMFLRTLQSVTTPRTNLKRN